MNRRQFLQSPPLVSAVQAAAQPPRPATPSSKANVIWVFGDQHRAQAISANGDPNVRTPDVDNLATMGVNFTHALSCFPFCCPFRGSLLTSRYSHVRVPGHEFPLPDGQPTRSTLQREWLPGPVWGNSFRGVGESDVVVRLRIGNLVDYLKRLQQ